MDEAFLRSVSLFTKSFLTEICSKFSINTEMKRFSKMNWPIIRSEKKKKVAEIGLSVDL
jgi:hypothetical protein